MSIETKYGGDRQWHLDKRVPIALIITLIIQTAGAVWWAATMSARVENMEDRMKRLDDNPRRIIRVEERQQAIFQRLDRIESLQRRIDQKLDQLLMQRYGPNSR